MAGYIGQAPANKFLTLDKQTFTTSATDTYSLDKTVSSANEIELFLNNVRQEPIEAYTVSGNTLTLASAITSSDTMYCIYQGKAIGTVSPATNSVSNDMLVNSSVTVNGTSISLGASGTISAGITEADQWRVTANFSNSGNGVDEDTTSNWERADTSDFEKIGTGLSQSSGIFSFPSTGKYLIDFRTSYYPSGANSGIYVKIKVTTDNSTYTTRAQGLSGSAGADRPENIGTSCIIDVTDTSNVKFKITTNGATNVSWQGNSNSQEFGFTSIRLGDT